MRIWGNRHERASKQMLAAQSSKHAKDNPEEVQDPAGTEHGTLRVLLSHTLEHGMLIDAYCCRLRKNSTAATAAL